MYHNSQISESAVRWDLTVLSYLKTLNIGLAGVCTHDLPALSRPALSQLS